MIPLSIQIGYTHAFRLKMSNRTRASRDRKLLVVHCYSECVSKRVLQPQRCVTCRKKLSVALGESESHAIAASTLGYSFKVEDKTSLCTERERLRRLEGNPCIRVTSSPGFGVVFRRDETEMTQTNGRYLKKRCLVQRDKHRGPS